MWRVSMIVNSIYFNSNVLLYTYLFAYNTTLLSLIFTFLSSITPSTKTMHSLSNYSSNSFSILVLSVGLFSLGGVPPFLGFFTKLFILNTLVTSNFYLLYFSLFILLFLGLYFYIQNFKFLHSTSAKNSSNTTLLNEKVSLHCIYFCLSCIIFLALGFLFIDDLIVFFTWLSL